MANYYAQAILAPASGLSEDVNVNTFAFVGPNVFTTTEGNAVNDCIRPFYNTMLAAGALKGRAAVGHSIKIYAATTVTPNYPIDETSFILNATPGAVELPLEVNLCVSYACDSATIVPRARRRGRIYIGGWDSTNNDTGRPTADTIEDLANAYTAYCDALNAIADFTASVWSRANASLYPIERVWCDNEWDTVRSRGGRSTDRYTTSV